MITGLEKINHYLTNNQDSIQDFYEKELSNRIKPIFTSVDIRYAGFKIAPVDTNLFPAGFNNCSEDGQKALKLEIRKYLNINFPGITKILILPESFTRNTKYALNLKVLQGAFIAAGFDTIVGSPLINDDINFEDVGLNIEVFSLRNNKLYNSNNWSPELIISNNDFTKGIPSILKDLNIRIMPSLNMGWHIRRKHKHFMSYDKLINNFCNLHGFDSWILTTYFENCENVNFKNKIGLECLAESVDKVIKRIQIKYFQYGIKTDPYVFVKSDQGTYGMGLMTVKSGQEILNINKKSRHSMHMLKSGVLNTNVIVQEGIPTVEKFENASAESLAYLCNCNIVEIFNRVHLSKDMYSSLNSPGMSFNSQRTDTSDNLFPLKNFVAIMASIATLTEV